MIIISLPFLKMDCQFLVASPEEDESQKSQMTAVETEKQEDDIVQSVDLYDYSDDEANQLINQIIRSFALLSLCAKILPNFEHALKKAEKDSLVDLIYTLPNKIFFRWAF